MGDRIALVRATVPDDQSHYFQSFEEKKLADSLAISTLQAWFAAQPDHWDVLAINPVLDELTAVETAQVVLSFGPSVVGISLTYQWQEPWAAQFAGAIKSAAPDTHVIVGGMFATSAWSKLLNEVADFDSVCRFEGEHTMLELARLIRDGAPWQGIDGLAHRDSNGTPVFHKLRQRIRDLGSLPFPTRDYLPKALAAGGVIQIEASRACNARCTFCDVRMTGWIGRPVGHFVDELQQLASAHPGQEIWIVDNIFIGFGKGRFERARALAREIIERGVKVSFTFQDRAENVDEETFALLKQAGLNKVYIGVESFADGALQRWQKGGSAQRNIEALLTLRKLEIPTQIGFLVFDDQTTIAEIRETLDGLRRVALDNPYLHLHNFNQLIPYAGTHLEREYTKTYGHPPDVLSDDIWQFEDSRIPTYRKWAWEFLLRIWPATEAIFHNFDNPVLQSDLMLLVPEKNRIFVEYMQRLLDLVERDEDPAKLCARHVRMTRETLESSLSRLTQPAARMLIAEALAGIPGSHRDE